MCTRIVVVVLLAVTCAKSPARGDATPPKAPARDDATPPKAPARGDATPPKAPARGDGMKTEDAKIERVTTQFELEIERVVPRSRFSGAALIAAADPRFVLAGKVTWVQRPDVLALGSRQAFAIHSPTRLGLSGWQRGDTLCLLLVRTRSDGATRWELRATKPDAGCQGGG